MTNKQVKLASKMAGDWWANKLSDRYADKRRELAAAVATRVEQTFDGEYYWDWQGERKAFSSKIAQPSVSTECDYEPKGLLAAAVWEVFGEELPISRLFTSLQDLFPRKHSLYIDLNEMRPKEGYGNWTDKIKVE